MNRRRIYITGAIGSGKTHAARRLSEAFHLPCHCLDGLAFDRESKQYRQQFPPAVRQQKLEQIFARNAWIIEGWSKGDWLTPIYRQAEIVIILDVSLAVRRWRITTRFFKRKLGLVPDPVPLGGLRHLFRLYRWTRLFDAGKAAQEIRAHAEPGCQIHVLPGDMAAIVVAGEPSARIPR